MSTAVCVSLETKPHLNAASLWPPRSDPSLQIPESCWVNIPLAFHSCILDLNLSVTYRPVTEL